MIAKTFPEFNKKKGGKNGLQPVCRPCQKAYQKERREANPGLHAARCAKWYAEKVWREKNPDLAKALDDASAAAALDRTAKPCRHCGDLKPLSTFNKSSVTPDGLQYRCRPCQKELKRDWYVKNRESELQNVKDWRKANPEKVRAIDRRRHAARPERSLIQGRRWRAENREKYLEQNRAWKSANPEKVRATARALYAKDPNKSLVKAHARRVKSHITGTVFNKQDIDRIHLLQKGKCACCHIKIGKKFERDHIIPLALGGTNDHFNIQLLCSPCNRTKSAKHPVDFMQERGFLL